MGFLLCRLCQHPSQVCVDLGQGGPHMLHVIDLAHVGAKLLETLQAALQNAVKLADHVSHSLQILVGIGTLLEFEHHLESEVQVRQERHQQELILDQIHSDSETNLEKLIALVEERPVQEAELVE